jgi:hypothetical protein
MDMATTKTIGHFTSKGAEKRITVWKEYLAAAKAFSDAKTAAEAAKDKVKHELVNLADLPEVKGKDVNAIDFTLNGGNVTVIEYLQPKEGRRRVKAAF